MTWYLSPNRERFTGGTGWLVSAYPGGGIRGADLPSTGSNGASVLFADASLPAENNDEFSWRIVSGPAGGGDFVPYEDGSYYYLGPTTSLVYEGFKNYMPYGTASIDITVAPATTSVASDQLISYSVRNRLNSDFSTTFSVLVVTQADFIASFKGLSVTRADFNAAFKSLVVTQADFNAVYALLSVGVVQSTLNNSFVLNREVVSDWLGGYGNVLKAESDFTANYLMDGRIYRTLIGSYILTGIPVVLRPVFGLYGPLDASTRQGRNQLDILNRRRNMSRDGTTTLTEMEMAIELGLQTAPAGVVRPRRVWE